MTVSKYIPCFLTDNKGNILNPYEAGAISYTELSFSENRLKAEFESPSGKAPSCNIVSVLIEGYVAYCADGRTLSTPVYFSMIRYFYLYAPKPAELRFRVDLFKCCAAYCFQKEPCIEISIVLDTTVTSEKNVSLRVPVMNEALHVIGSVCINTDRIWDHAAFRSEARLLCQTYLLKAEIYQYNALSNGEKRVYTSEDELILYGSRGILSPEKVSFYELFVDGVLQPKPTYKITKDTLAFLTEDIPSRGKIISIVFYTYKNRSGHLLRALYDCYCARSDGEKRTFTNADELAGYGQRGIPSPNDVSWSALYINGVLQPKATYVIKKGSIELTTEDVPPKGASITLESICLFGLACQLINSDIYLYNAETKGQKIYTNADELTAYGNKGIPDPNLCSFQNLYINCVIQPECCYTVCKGCLSLKTADAPTQKAPVTLRAAKMILTETIIDTPTRCRKLSSSSLCNTTTAAITYPYQTKRLPSLTIDMKKTLEVKTFSSADTHKFHYTSA